MKYMSRSAFWCLIAIASFASFNVQAAVTSPTTVQIQQVDDFGIAIGRAIRALPSIVDWQALKAVKTPLAAIAPMPAPAPRPAPPRTTGLGVFNSVAISAARLPAAEKWNAVSNRDYARLFTDACDTSGLAGCHTAFATKLRAVSARVQDLGTAQMLGVVNRSVNGAMRYRTDARIWGQSDYWANPSEIARKGAGDCEDFAIAKYWLLRSLGVSADKLQIVVLSDTRRQLYHAVLVAHLDGTAYVLDNLANRVAVDTHYANYVPIMSFVAGKSYIHGFSGHNSAVAALPSDMRLISPGEGI